MRGSELYEAEIYCKDIVRRSADLLRWDWDEKFCTVSAKFTKSAKSSVLSILRSNFMFNWDSRSIRRASGTVLQFVEALGGVRGDQKLFMSDPEQEIFLFAAWWPWSDSDNISLRIGCVVDNLPEEEEVALLQDFRGWFGV